MKELLTYILENALGPDTEVVVRQTETELGVTLEIEIPSHARGKIIGRNGLNIKALREVMNILAQRQQKRVFLKVLD